MILKGICMAIDFRGLKYMVIVSYDNDIDLVN